MADVFPKSFSFFFYQTLDGSGYQGHVRDEESGITSSPADLPEDGNEEVVALENSRAEMFNPKSEPFLFLLHTLLLDSQNATQPDTRQSLEVPALPLPLMGRTVADSAARDRAGHDSQRPWLSTFPWEPQAPPQSDTHGCQSLTVDPCSDHRSDVYTCCFGI